MKFLLLKYLGEGKDDGSGELHPDHKSAIPNGHWYQHAGNYDHYRLLIAAASTDGKTAPKDFSSYGPFGEHPFSSAYSKEDQDIINIAKKMCGIKSTSVSDNKSSEPEHINKISSHNTKAHKTPRFPWETRKK
jgi:hypothetical protein